MTCVCWAAALTWLSVASFAPAGAAAGSTHPGSAQPASPSGAFIRAAAAATPACIEGGSDQGVVRGRLTLLDGIGPAAFLLIVPAGVCVTGPQPEDRVEDARTVQLYATTPDGMNDLYRLVGEKVYVRGKLSAGRTFQQKAPLLMEVIEIATE